MSRVVRSVAVGVLAAGFLAGCSDDAPRPRMAPSPTSSPSPTSAPTTPAPSPTAAALGPEETVRAWVAARNVTVQNGDSTEVYALSTADCTTCQDSIEPVVEVYRAGGRFETVGWKVVKSRVVESSGRAAEVSAALLYESGRTIPSKGAEPVLYEEDRRIAVFRLGRREGSWLVTFVGYLS